MLGGLSAANAMRAALLALGGQLGLLGLAQSGDAETTVRGARWPGLAERRLGLRVSCDMFEYNSMCAT